MAMLLPNLRGTFGRRRPASADRRALLRLIVAASEQRLPLPPLVEAWANEHPWRWGWRLRSFAETLRAGASLPDAVERHPGLLSDEDALLIRHAAESGVLGPTLRARVDGDWDEPSEETAPLRQVVVYAALAFPICLYFSVKVIPELKSVFAEFSIPIAGWSTVTHAMSSWLVSFWWAPLAVVLAGWILSAGGWPGRSLRRRFGGRLSLALRSRRVATILRRLGETATAGRPLPGAVSTLARYHYDPTVRHQLLLTRNEYELGTELWPAMEGAGLINADERRVLASADTVELRAWTLLALADTREERARRRQFNFAWLAWLLALLAFAAFVCVASMGVFDSLNSLTYALS